MEHRSQYQATITTITTTTTTTTTTTAAQPAGQMMRGTFGEARQGSPIPGYLPFPGARKTRAKGSSRVCEFLGLKGM
jgi:hypothetical protein